jgi:hypothetical protein
LYYVEFVRPSPGVSLEEFRTKLRERTLAWAERYPEDDLLYMIERSWHLGPEPGFLIIWRARDHARLDVWKRDLGLVDPQGAISEIVDAALYEDLGHEQL